MQFKIQFLGTRKESGEKYSATGCYDTDKNELTIFTGSSWALKISNQRILEIRKQLIRDGFVDGGTGIFKKNYICRTSQQNRKGTPITNASQIICGTPRDVTAWRIVSSDKKLKGRKLYDYLEEIGVVKKGDNGNSRQWVEPEKRKSFSPIGGGDVDPKEESERADSTNRSQENGEAYDTNKEIAEEIKSKGFLNQNIIFYGVPGCGKSYKIDELLHLKDDKGNSPDGKYYKRILFHPEYSYSDFVGQLRPEVGDDNKITYKFVPGPFTEILLDAYKDREHDYFLIIEEINRGNAPAIFGDLFQLLDRKDGVSEYSIDNKDILDYFERKLEIARESEKDDISAMAQAVETIKREGVRIPENLTIFATMNTCDQNVFTLDTAFKRRWRMSRIENKFDAEQDKWIIQCGDKKFSWEKFAEAVNDAILNYCNDGTAAEDKRLGAYFVKKEDTEDAKRFAEKVMMYLWDDVAKYDRSQLFDNKYRTLDEVIEGFAAGRNVFSPNCEKLKALYEEKDDPLVETGAEAAEEAEKSKNPETDADVPDKQAEA